MRRTVLPVLLLVAVASPAFAWNVTGHEIAAAEAYDLLIKEHPETVAKIAALLKQHPLYDKMMADKLDAVPAESRDKWLMMVAARWPDDVRRGPAGYSHPTWHYVDFPITPPGDVTVGPQPEPPNAITSLEAQTGVLKGDNPAADKSVAICWILHLVGDIHQPLHCVSLYSRQHPKGDKGGNDTFVRFGDKRTINLHQVWDETLGQDAKFKSCSSTAAELLARPEFAPDRLPEANDADPQHWAAESVDIAKRITYANMTIEGGTADAGQSLPDDYGKQAKAAAERRMVLAGYRLAERLQSALGDAPAATSTPAPAPAGPTPGGREYIGPRGGHYHIDANGKKIYDKKS